MARMAASVLRRACVPIQPITPAGTNAPRIAMMDMATSNSISDMPRRPREFDMRRSVVTEPAIAGVGVIVGALAIVANVAGGVLVRAGARGGPDGVRTGRD